MQTTLELDDELIANVEEIARERGSTVSEVISSLAWQAMQANKEVRIRNGLRLLDPLPGRPPVDLEFVNMLRDEEP